MQIGEDYCNSNINSRILWNRELRALIGTDLSYNIGSFKPILPLPSVSTSCITFRLITTVQLTTAP